MIFKISDDKKSIEIEEKGDKDATFDELKSKLVARPDCPRYVVVDVEINTASGTTANKLCFIMYSDDNNAPTKQKMLYASSKDALKKAINGIAQEHQACDASDLDYDEIKKLCSR